MPKPTNASFETEGPSPGVAEDWTTTTSFSGPLMADFGDPLPNPAETFEAPGWGTNPYGHVVSGGAPATFDVGVAPQPSSAETFLRWSNNAGYQTTVQGGVAAQFDGVTSTVEDFLDAGWDTAGYELVVTPSGPWFTETFDGWGTYQYEVIGGTSATFNNDSTTVESFESVSADVLFVVDNPATGLCTTPNGAHGKPNGFKVTVLSTGSRPSGLAANQVYYLNGVGATSFYLAKTPGGLAVTFADYGNGDHYIHADETLYWTETE